MMRKILTIGSWLLGISIIFVGCVPVLEIKEEMEKEEPQKSEAKLRYSYGRDYYRKRMYAQAIKNFKIAVKESTTYIDAYIGMVSCYDKKGDNDSVKLIIGKIIALDTLQGYYALGRFYTDEGRIDEALKTYREVIDLNPNYADAYDGMGYTFSKITELDSAIFYYKKAVELEPENESMRFRLGKAYVKAKRYNEGIKELEEVIKLHPTDLDIRRHLGEAYLVTKSYEEAEEQFMFILSKSPTNKSAHMSLGIAYAGMKRCDDAIKEYNEAIKIDSFFVLPCYRLIDLYTDAGNYTQAISVLCRARKVNPEDQTLYYFAGTIHFNIARKLFKEKKYKPCMKECDTAILEYKKAMRGADKEMTSNAKKAINNVKKLYKQAKDEAWW